MTEGTHTFWSFTINNYDATDLALITQGYPDYIREIAFTLEKGAETGTPHVQAFVKLMRPQRLTFLKKLFPRAAHCKFLEADEYKLNAKRYSVKQDGTATSPSVIINNPFQDPVSELLNVTRSVLKNFLYEKTSHIASLKFEKDVSSAYRCVESLNVQERPTLAKFYVSAAYTKIKAEYWREFMFNIQNVAEAEARVSVPTIGDTHTHTHSAELISREGGIDSDASGTEGDDASWEEDDPSGDDGEEDEDYDERICSEDEADCESGSAGCCSSDDGSGY